MKKFRKVIFWTHLIAALAAGVVIFVMSVTGALLAFEKNIIEYAERDARIVTADAGAEPLSPQAVIDKFKEQMPDAKPSSMLMSNDKGAAWIFSLGRDGLVFVDPYTGSITGNENKQVREVMSWLRSWHRWLGMSGDDRAIGKALTGASNLVFLFLAISGIYIWMPRKINWRSVKPVLWFRRGLRGKPRNFNWHNVIGFWTSLLLIVFTITGAVISYQWAGNLIYTITGNEIPERREQEPKKEKPYEFPANIDASWAAARTKAPDAKSISLKLPVEDGAAAFTIDEGIYWNIFGRSNLTVESDTGNVAKWEPYGEQNSARQLRTWSRFTHTGESGGIIGQIIGFIACVGGAFLVWTGFSLAFRRFFRWRKRTTADPLS